MKSYRKSTGRKRRGVSWFGRGVEEMEPRVLLSSATFELTSDWGTGFGGQITIANTQSTAVNNWTLSFRLGSFDYRYLGRIDHESRWQRIHSHERWMELDNRTGRNALNLASMVRPETWVLMCRQITSSTASRWEPPHRRP